MDLPSSEPNRVALACIQCRSRHVKCDATQPVCNRCRREGKECNYQRSRRGGLDKAALARRRLALQQQAERSQQANESADHGHHSSSGSSHSGGPEDQVSAIPRFRAANIVGSDLAASSTMAFQVSADRLLDLYYENFFPGFPMTLPLHHLNQRKMNENHGMQELLLVLQWVGSIYAPWAPSESYYETAYQALCRPMLPRTGFSVQALMIFAIAQCHSELRAEAHTMLDAAVAIGLDLQINSKDFAYQHGEGNPVLEESWRRTYYFLYLSQQHFAIIENNPNFTLRDFPALVDLPCDDEYYESGYIPPTVTWQEYESREFADFEVVYSSIVYLFDISRVASYIMQMFVEAGTLRESVISAIDAKVAVWQALLPVCKKDPLRQNGQVDEVLFLAHMTAAILIMITHRPFSSLVYSLEELLAESIVTPVPFMEPMSRGRNAHTARALKAADMQTKMLAIPCTIERHHVFTMCIVASITAAQVSACNVLLEDHALSIARDRVRLGIGFLNAIGNHWPLAKKMAREVRFIARRTLAGPQSDLTTVDPNAVVEIPRDGLIWPVGDPAAHIDIYSGIVVPMNWDVSLYQSSSPSTIS